MYRVYITDYQKGEYSRHYTIDAAIRSGHKLDNKVRRDNGPASYLPWCIEEREKDSWKRIDHSDR